MPYRNKTYVAFASEDIKSYWLMTAWKANKGIDFNFFDAHAINTALDTSQPETIRRRLRERLVNTKQCVVLVSDTTRPKAARSSSFLYYEVEVIERLNLPIVFANINMYHGVQESKLPEVSKSRYSISVPFSPAIIKYALDNFPNQYDGNLRAVNPKNGPYEYKASVFTGLGLTY